MKNVINNCFSKYRDNSIFLVRSLFVTIFSMHLGLSLNAQTTVDWKLDGNNVSTDSKFGTNTEHDIIFETNNSERIRLTKEGRLGLGTSDPQYKLDLIGDLRILGDAYFSSFQDYSAEEKRFAYMDPNGILKVGSTGDLLDYVYKVDCKVMGSNPYPGPVWQSIAGEDQGLLFTATGCPARVGIGTNDPQRLLEVNGRASITEQLDIAKIFDYENSQDPGKLNVFAPSEHGLTIISKTNQDKSAVRVLRYSDENTMVLNLSGKGFMAMKYFATDGEMPLSINRAGTTENIFRVRPEGGIDLDFTGSAAEIAFAVRSSTGDLVDITGDGKIWCQGIHVKYAPFWPDYVFDKGYELLPLSEVENFIKTKGHLPGVPSACEITEKGVDLYETTRVLLEKVEELTLYIIQQEKEIQELRANQNAVETTCTKADNSELPAIKGNKGGENE